MVVPRRLYLGLSLLLLASPAAAQGGPNTFNVSALTSLDFGTIVAGMGKNILPTDPAAGSLLITGPKHTQVSLSFMVPSALAYGPTPMPISFGPTSALWSGTSAPGAGASIDPSRVVQIPMPDTRTIYVWIGASLLVPSAQKPGPYGGTVTLTVVLN